MYRTPAPRVPDWKPPFWLRARNYMRGDGMEVFVLSATVFLTCLTFLLPLKLLIVATKLLLGSVASLVACFVNLFTSRKITVEIDL